MATSTLDGIKGGRELQEYLNTLPAKIEKNLMKAALRQGANVILEAARQNAPSETGALRRSIKVSTGGRSGEAKAIIRAGGKTSMGKNKGSRDVWYALLVEYGTAPHSITVGQDSKALGVPNKPVHTVSHPGAAPRPYMRPAIDEKADAAVRKVGEILRQRLSTEHGIDVPMPAEPDDT